MYKIEFKEDPSVLGYDSVGHRITENSWHKGYPWYKLEVGQAFFVPNRDVVQMRNAFNSGPRKRFPELVFKFWNEDNGCWCKRMQNKT